MYTTKYDILIDGLEAKVNNAKAVLTQASNRLKQASCNAVCELIDSKQGDVIAVTFGTNTLDWKICEADNDGDGVIIRLVQPVERMLGERILRLSEVREGKYDGRITLKA